VLAAVEQHKYVILCGHSNTERGYLRILQEKLQREIDAVDFGEDLGGIEVITSYKDNDPLEIV